MGQTFSSFTPPSFVHNTPGELTHFDRSWPSPPQSPTPFISFNLFTREVVNIHPVRHSSSLLCHRRRPFSRITDPDWQSDEEDLIPKPTGAAGHPGNGGYKLSKALNWQGKDYYRFREFVREAACAHLDTDKNLRSQSRAALRLVNEEAINKFPRLFFYEDFWPLNDCLRSVLKTEKARKRRLQKKIDPLVSSDQNLEPEPEALPSET